MSIREMSSNAFANISRDVHPFAAEGEFDLCPKVLDLHERSQPQAKLMERQYVFIVQFAGDGVVSVPLGL